MKDLTGQRFGKLIVQKYTGERKWHCLCDCGNEVEAYGFNLSKGATKSCGCIVRNRGDITGQRFGSLLVAEKIPSQGKNSRYLCKCDCGNFTEVNRSALVDGKVISCGCLSRENFLANIRHLAGHIEGTCVSIIKSKKLNRTNTSGVTGVYWDKTRQKWAAQIVFKGKRYFLGRYFNYLDAKKARKAAEDKLHGDFLEWYENEHKKKGV